MLITFLKMNTVVSPAAALKKIGYYGGVAVEAGKFYKEGLEETVCPHTRRPSVALL